MKKRIFKGIFYVAIIVWLACLVLIIGAMYNQYSQKDANELKSVTYTIAHGINKCGEGFLSELKFDDNHRITLIAGNGKVLFDSEEDAAIMENHSDRPEVIEALKLGESGDTRYSKTLSKETTYYAVLLDNGDITRVSETQFTILTLFISMLQPILIVLIIAIVLSVILASRIAKTIVMPINQIDLENPNKSEIYEELKPFIEKISEQNREINQQISKLQVDVNEKTREAKFRREFTANVSHELKTPLTSISGFAEIIKDGIAKECDIKRFAGKIYDEAQRLVSVVGDIIKLSQLDEDAVTARKESIDLYTACENVIDSLEILAKKRNITFEQTGKHVYIMAVGQIIDEIIYNLCDNAVKYNKNNGKIFVKTGIDNGNPFLKVSDTGIGIPDSEQNRVFERFYRVNKSHSKEIGGTGLGLSIVKHGAAYHNANVSIDSQLNKGTTITITFLEKEN